MRTRNGDFALALILALAASGCGANGGVRPATKLEPPVSSVAPAAAPYALALTLSCLRHRKARVELGRSRDRHLRALHDSAQRTSVDVVVGTDRIGLAIVAQAADANLLAEVLQPAAPDRIAVYGNALLLFPPRARAVAALTRACLRG